MTITQTNKLNIAYKRLSGLVNSNPFLGTGNETIASNVQIGSSTIFGQAIDTDPAVTVNAGIAERKVFKLTAVPSGYYIEPGEGNDPKPHVWKLQEYQDSTSTWIDFQGQLIGSSFGEGYYPKLYRNFAGDNGTDFGAADVNLQLEVAKLSEMNWMIDYFAGTLWFQNLTSEVPTDSWVVVAYKYTGQYLDTVVGAGGGGGTSPLPAENTVYRPTGAALNNADYFPSIGSVSDTIKYFLFYGNPTDTQGISHPDGHKVTQISLKNLSSKYGTTKSKEIVIKNLGIDPNGGWPDDARSTIEIKVAEDPNSPVTDQEYPLNGSYESFYLYTKGETVTLLWDGDGEEWHII